MSVGNFANLRESDVHNSCLYFPVKPDSATLGNEGIGPLPFEVSGLVDQDIEGLKPGSMSACKIPDCSAGGIVQVMEGVKPFDFYVDSVGKYGLFSEAVLKRHPALKNSSFSSVRKVQVDFGTGHLVERFWARLKHYNGLRDMICWECSRFHSFVKKEFWENRWALLEGDTSIEEPPNPSETDLRYENVSDFLTQRKQNRSNIILPSHLCLKISDRCFPEIVNLTSTLTIVRHDLAQMLGKEIVGMHMHFPEVSVILLNR